MEKPIKPIKPIKIKFKQNEPTQRKNIIFNPQICKGKCNEKCNYESVCRFKCCEGEAFSCSYLNTSLKDLINIAPKNIDHKDITISYDVDDLNIFILSYNLSDNEYREELTKYQTALKKFNLENNDKYTEQYNEYCKQKINYNILMAKYKLEKQKEKVKELENANNN